MSSAARARHDTVDNIKSETLEEGASVPDFIGWAEMIYSIHNACVYSLQQKYRDGEICFGSRKSVET